MNLIVSQLKSSHFYWPSDQLQNLYILPSDPSHMIELFDYDLEIIYQQSFVSREFAGDDLEI